jgi:hypothetical protein
LRRKSPTSSEWNGVAGSGTSGFADGLGPWAQFDQPQGLATDLQGNMYVVTTTLRLQSTCVV